MLQPELKLRRDKIRSLMVSQGIDAALITCNANLIYTYGCVVSGYLYLPLHSPALLFFKRPNNITGEHSFPIRKPEQIVDILKEKGLPLPTKLMLEGDELPYTEYVRLAGLFPEGKEFNVYCDTPASRVVAERWPTEIIFSGFEIGNMIFTGKKLVQMDVEDSPVKDAYSLCFAEGDPNGRMSWDLTAVLVAVKGYEPYYNVERGTFRVVNDEGANSWTPDGKGKDLRLIEKVPAVEMAVLIENYMMHQPVSK